MDSYVAAIEGRLVGYSATFFRQNAKVARLHSLAVDPALAGRGMGRLLLEVAESNCHARNAAILRLAVRQDNMAAIHLYRSAGYRELGVEFAYYSDGTTAVKMEKVLAGAR